jgi:hypothetical protein
MGTLSTVLRIAGTFCLSAMIGVSPRAWQAPALAEEASAIPAWLQPHVGLGDGQIAPVVLQRARALYLQKHGQGTIRNPCYLAMDATRPSSGHRFYVICEDKRSFAAVSSGHGSGRNLSGIANFANDRECARNFGNAEDSLLTAGGSYVTAETKDSFKGYYRSGSGQDQAFIRSFVQFDGEGEAGNARRREIGGHPSQLLKAICLQKRPSSPYADHDGYVPVGTLVDYAAGRSNGCTSWSASDARQIIGLVRSSPTTVYIYPESSDVASVAQAVRSGRSPASSGLYWNASCLKRIGAPKFWSAASLGPMIARYAASHPPPPSQPTPICGKSIVAN